MYIIHHLSQSWQKQVCVIFQQKSPNYECISICNPVPKRFASLLKTKWRRLALGQSLGLSSHVHHLANHSIATFCAIFNGDTAVCSSSFSIGSMAFYLALDKEMIHAVLIIIYGRYYHSSVDTYSWYSVKTWEAYLWTTEYRHEEQGEQVVNFDFFAVSSFVFVRWDL